jgi:hypothetical protein
MQTQAGHAWCWRKFGVCWDLVLQSAHDLLMSHAEAVLGLAAESLCELEYPGVARSRLGMRGFGGLPAANAMPCPQLQNTDPAERPTHVPYSDQIRMRPTACSYNDGLNRVCTEGSRRELGPHRSRFISQNPLAAP